MATNLVEFTFVSDDGERSLFICPILLQSKEKPSFEPPLKAYIYENLVKEEFGAALGKKGREIMKGLGRNELVVKHDQDFEKVYLGYLIYFDESKQWKWQGNSEKLNHDDIEKLEVFLNNYKKGSS